jgi:4-diphosphocytidyl-2-C-methyl-D-erythritol kinase
MMYGLKLGSDLTVVSMDFTNAPAKINLALHVTGQRQDGYHLLDTLVVFAATIHASDTIIVSHSPVDGFGISGPFGDVLKDTGLDTNLIIKARDHVREIARDTDTATPPVHISLEKRLPIAAGLGGGSADAAAAFKALYKHWDVGYHPRKSGASVLAELLGADVPMCMSGKPLRATGIGDEISTIPEMPPLHLVLVNCGEMVSTATIFSALDEKQNSAIADYPDTPADLVQYLRTQTRNDLQPAAIEQCATISDCLDALNQNGAMLSRMSGSGATCFGLFPSAYKAGVAARAIAKSEPKWWVTATNTSGSSI